MGRLLWLAAALGAAGCGKVDEVVTVTVTTVGPGTVTSQPQNLVGIASGTSVTLTAVGDLLAWGGACSGTTTCTFTADENKTVSATFEGTQMLTVTPGGTGMGTTTSTPAGIDCGANCTSEFTAGSIVTLTQTTSDPNTRIGGWADPACPKNQPCIVTADAAKTLTSYFDTMLIDTCPTPTTLTDARTNGAISLTISAAAATVITELDEALVVQGHDTRVRFAIFDVTTMATLYVTDPVVAQVQNPVASVMVHSPPMSFVMTAGKQYQFAAIVEGTAAFPWSQTAVTMGGLTAAAQNGNPTDFVNPTFGGGGGVTPRFQIWGHAQ